MGQLCWGDLGCASGRGGCGFFGRGWYVYVCVSLSSGRGVWFFLGGGGLYVYVCVCVCVSLIELGVVRATDQIARLQLI